MLQTVLGTLGNISFILSDKWDHNMSDYLYFQDIDGESYVINHIGVPSQFLRKILANSLNLDTWNWREFPYLENIEENIKFYQKIKSKEYF